MRVNDKTKEQLLKELSEMRQRIADLEKSETELKQATQQWQTSFDSIHDLVSIHDKDFNIVRVNKAFSNALKKKSEELIGKKCYEVIHGTNEPWPHCPHKQTLATEEPITEEFFEPVLGIYLQVSTSPVFDEKGKINGTVHIARDITERRKTEIETRLHSDIVANMKEGVNLIREKDGVIVYTNPKFEEMFGYGHNELIGKHISVVNDPAEKSPGQTVNEIMESLNKKGMWQGEIQNMKKNRTSFWTHASISTFDYSEYGKVFLSVQTEITERKKMEEVLERAHSELEMRVKERTTELESTVKLLQGEITERKKIENELQETEKRLIAQTTELTESNAALKALLRQREEDKEEIENNILSNIKHLVQPYVEKLKRNKPVSGELTYLKILESNLEDIVSPFASKLSSKYLGFSPRELQVADLIKDGKQDKEIIEILNISPDTIKVHRKNIRRKLGIYREKINLRTKLLSLDK